MIKEYKNLWIGLIVLIILSPLGIIIPKKLNAGSTWGEWNSDKVGDMTGFVPKEMKKFEMIWNAKISGYNFKGFNGLALSSLGYILSAIIGILVIVFLFYLFGRILYPESREDNL